MSLLYVTLALVSWWRQHRPQWAPPPPGQIWVTVALPCYNEEKVVAKTLAALARTSYQRFDTEAVAWTEAPMTVRALARQRLRWTYGNLQAFRKHRNMVLRPRYGVLGMIVLPYALLSVIVPLAFMPLTYIAAGLSIASGRWQNVALFAVFVAGVHLVISIVAVRMVRERLWHLLVVPIYRLIIRAAARVRAVPVAGDGGERQGDGLVSARPYRHRLTRGIRQ